MSDKTDIPVFATHPGELIKDELHERDMSQKELAQQTGIKPSVLNEIIKGKRAISLKVAVSLEKILGISADYWMNLQMQYNLDTAAIEGRDNLKETVSLTIPIKDRNLLRSLAHKFGWACIF